MPPGPTHRLSMPSAETPPPSPARSSEGRSQAAWSGSQEILKGGCAGTSHVWKGGGSLWGQRLICCRRICPAEPARFGTPYRIEFKGKPRREFQRVNSLQTASCWSSGNTVQTQAARLRTETTHLSSVWRSLAAVHRKGAQLRLVKTASLHGEGGSLPLCAEVLHPHRL